MDSDNLRRRRNNFIAGLGIFAAVTCLGIAGGLGASYFTSSSPIPNKIIIYFSLLVLFGTAGLGVVLALYLKGLVDFGSSVTITTTRSPLDSQQQRVIADLITHVEQLRAFRGERSIGESGRSEAAEVTYPVTKASLNKVHAYYSEAVEAAQRNIHYIERRSLASLVMGTVATFLAFTVIWVLSVRGSAVPFNDWASFAFHFIPRATLAIFIELFAFFFLRLHRQSLAELRRCNMDLRDLSLQYAAVELAWDAPEESARRIIGENLIVRTSALPSAELGKMDGGVQISVKDVVEILAVIAKRDK
ncbi:hypothetical protein [Xanthomonas cannabis]|uniref:Uncharacterized protein n=1 Tax=Xanthomonas cannabis TaxID=1885674 RepID=A0ABR6JPB0_9XANT|nr:hypothetical protein [Xanthomonas cannabis]MBB4594652.1 hypothetical protein [Xanthomonas cannabis]MBB5523415.1 hypothetical protein [Xanthomonas cannabis]